MHSEYSPLVVTRFWARIDKNGPIPAHRPELGPCWLWTGCCRPDGYGVLNTGKGTARTHRMAWELAFGPILGRLCVLHHCDNRRCVRPSHLFLGTRPDNSRDMVSKGRSLKGREFPERRGDASWIHVHRDLLPRGDDSFPRRHPERLAHGASNGAYTHPERRPRGERNGNATHPERRPRAETHGCAKLTWEQVGIIRALYAAGGTTHKSIAERFGLHRTTISLILTGKHWRPD